MSALPEKELRYESEKVAYEGLEALTKIPIGPMRVSALSAHELTRRLIGHTFGNKTHHVVTANAQFYVLAERDAIFRRCVEEAEYVCADGVSVVMACKWLGNADISRVAGVDLIPMLCEQGATLGLPIYFLGGKPNSEPGHPLCGIGSSVSGVLHPVACSAAQHSRRNGGGGQF